MKANRKFLNNEDEAVSPVIAVILMVAITVVLAATVYVWVSGFSGQNTAAAASLSVSQVSALTSTGTTLQFTVTSASPGFDPDNLKVLNPTTGKAFTYDGAAAAAGGEFNIYDDGVSTDLLAGTEVLGAGDVIHIVMSAAADIDPGNTIQFIDTNSNNVISSVVAR